MNGLLRKVLTIGFVVLFLGAIGSAFFKGNTSAYAAGTIYIRANGLVEGTDKIVNANNVTYTFTDDINDSVVVERSNVIIDGDEYTLNGSLSLMVGFNLTSVSNVTIKNINIEGFLSYSIYLESASQCVISNNTVTGSEGGIGLFSSTGNLVSGNRITDCSETLDLFSASGNVISGNNMSGSSSGVHANSCTGNTISGNIITANNQGILLSGSSDFNTINGNDVKANIDGVCLESSSGNSISGNEITNNSRYGMRLRSSSNNNTLSGNNITANNNIGIYLDESSNNVISGNNIGDSPNEHIGLLHSSNNNSIFGNNLTNSTADVGIYVYACSLNSFFGNNITANANSGIRIDSSSDSTISENNISENPNGIYLWYSSNITISGNNITENDADGIVLDNSKNNHLNGNTIASNNWWGINPAYSNNNTISGNNIRNNNVGINSASSDFNIISANNIIDNVYSGIYLESSSNNTFQHNNLINNTNQAVVDELGYANNWDDGYPSGGNYWSDYNGTDQYEGPSQNIAGNDTIGDTPYEINADNVDRYPLMTQYEPLRPLFLESEERWNMGEATWIEVWSVFAADVDDDGVVEIMTCAQVNQSAELRIYSYNGLAITLEHSELWQTDGDTRAWSVFASDVDGDGVTEILVGAEAKGQIFGQLRIWNWNGTTLTLEHSEEWQTVSWTHVYSVFAADIDDDGVTEIITGGDAFNGTYYNNQLRIWNWNGTTLTLESSREWNTGGGASVHSVYALDVDGDSTVEIVTAGQDNSVAQLRVWNWNGTVLTEEYSEEWSSSNDRALSVFASDIDNDGTVEIVTGGQARALFDSSWVPNGQLRVWNWNGSALTLEDSREWPLNGTDAYVWTICSGDFDRDGLAEILTTGASGSGAQLRVWSFNDSTLTLDTSQESVDEWADAAFALDVDGDGTTEIVTAGVAYDETYIYEQLKIWSFPESTPPTITIISPENKTYSTNTIPLTFTIDEPADWIGYSLDGQMNETITESITSPTLPDGVHRIVVYANDTYGNMGESATIYFTIDTTKPNITNISQDPLTDILPDTVVKINAIVTDATSEIKQVLLNCTFTNSTDTWTTLFSMTHITGYVWNATIPPYPYGTNVTYVIIAEDNAGNTITTEQIYGYMYEYRVVPEFPLPTILLALTMTTLFIAIISRKKKTLST
jgi:parallel beta-helix repeat protein